MLYPITFMAKLISRNLTTCGNRKKLLLISLDWTRPKDPPMSLGQASLLANLKKYDVETIDRSWSVTSAIFNVEEVVDFIMSNSCQQTYVGLGAFIWNEKYTKTILQLLKFYHFPGYIILGGPQISYAGTNLLENYYPEADVFIRGYGEEALVQLMTSNDMRPEITGIHYSGEPDRGLAALADVHDLPSPFLNGIIKAQHFIRWETQRGCQFRCSFCQYKGSNPKRVHIDPERVSKEIKWITSNPVIQDIVVIDPIFNSGKEKQYLSIIRELIDGKYCGKISLQGRMEIVNDEFLDAVQKLNTTAHVVLEFGLQTIHKNEWKFIDRPNNMKKVEMALNGTRDRNIANEITLIFGLPGQTVQSFQNTVDFCKNLGVPTIYAYPLMLLRGTALEARKEDLGLIESSDTFDTIPNRIVNNIPHVVASPTFTFEDWRKMADIAQSLDRYNNSMKMVDTLRHTLWNDKEIVDNV